MSYGRSSISVSKVGNLEKTVSTEQTLFKMMIKCLLNPKEMLEIYKEEQNFRARKRKKKTYYLQMSNKEIHN